jgi:hypothetical protein
MNNMPTIGPGHMEVCTQCVEMRKREVEHLVCEELEKHVTLLNGNDLLKDLMKLRRGQHDSEA